MSRFPAFALPAADAVPGLPVGDSGLVLGRDGGGELVYLNLFRERVTSLTALLTPDLVAVLGFRALVTGARLSVVTADPQPWTRAVALAGLGADDLTLLPPSAQPAEEASFARPLLVIRESDQLPGVIRLRPGPWRAALTVVPRFGPHAVAVARSSQVVILGAHTAEAATVTVRALNLPEEVADTLSSLADAEVALIHGDRVLAVHLFPTPFETALRQSMLQATAGSGGLTPPPLPIPPPQPAFPTP